MWKLRNKRNEQTKQKQTHKYREQTGGCQMGAWWGMVEKSERIEKYKLVVTKQSLGWEYNLGSIVNNILMATYNARWVLE